MPRQTRSTTGNPAAGKRPANARVGSYTRKDGTRVRSHSRQAGWARSKQAWAGLGFSTLTSTAIVLEAGVTLVSTLAIVAVALLTTAAVLAQGYADRNRKTLGKGRTRRTRRTTRTTSRRTRR